jgi:NitT/TauT family transport system permease protein
MATWLAIRKPVTGLRGQILKCMAFLIPLGIWCAISYCPYIWHPLIEVVSVGDSTDMIVGQTWEPQYFNQENERIRAEGKSPAVGRRANPPYLPEPHNVAKAMVKAFTEKPRKGDPWFHESLLQSFRTIFVGFTLAAMLAIPLGILCGTFDFLAKLTEPYIDFIRYMPAPVFGPLTVAVLGIFVAPKIAIVFIGVFFCMVLVVSNTTRSIDPALLEAAQTLGAKRVGLIFNVIVPGILPALYKDIRILLGSAWTYLMVAELIGELNGLSMFIYQQGRYRRFDNVFAGILIIGCAGFLTDQLLAFVGTLIFPWTPETNHRARRWFQWLGFITRPVEGSHPKPLQPEEIAAVHRRAGVVGSVEAVLAGAEVQADDEQEFTHAGH